MKENLKFMKNLNIYLLTLITFLLRPGGVIRIRKPWKRQGDYGNILES